MFRRITPALWLLTACVTKSPEEGSPSQPSPSGSTAAPEPTPVPTDQAPTDPSSTDPIPDGAPSNSPSEPQSPLPSTPSLPSGELDASATEPNTTPTLPDGPDAAPATDDTAPPDTAPPDTAPPDTAPPDTPTSGDAAASDAAAEYVYDAGPWPRDDAGNWVLEPAPALQHFACPAEVGVADFSATLTEVTGIPLDTEFGGGRVSTLEGAAWLGDTLYLSHIAHDAQPNPSHLLMAQLNGTPSTLLLNAGTNGLLPVNEQTLLATRHLDGALVLIDLPTLETKVWVPGYNLRPFNSPNDAAMRSDGNLYVTDPSYQWPLLENTEAGYRPEQPTRVYRLSPDLELSVVDEELSEPNGIALSLDETTLYVSGQSELTRYTLSAAGEPLAPEVVPLEESLAGSDGLGMDCSGVLYVTSGRYVYAVDVTVDPAAPVIVHSFDLGAGLSATNVAFGGAERKTMYVTSQGRAPKLFSIELGVVGRPY